MSQKDADQVDWRRNLGPDGKPTFLLPGETEISSQEMQRRTSQYYKQIRGRYSPVDAIARHELKKMRELLSKAD